MRLPNLFLLLLVVSMLAACGPSPANPSGASKRYALTGRVVSVDKDKKSLMVDGDEIPGFMSAMEMPYAVKDAGLLDKVAPGDKISADVVVRDDESWLENIVVTGHGTPPKPAAALHMPAPGDSVPDFVLVNQDGKPVSLSRYRGKALLVTFIYTRCPFPDFCPRISHSFAEIDRDLRADAGLFSRTHLLSISFDPAHDTPRVLREYGFACAGSKKAEVFKHWEFAVPPAAELAKIASFFGLAIAEDGGVINHSLSTVLIGPDGKIFKWYPGADWKASDLVQDAAHATRASV